MRAHSMTPASEMKQAMTTPPPQISTSKIMQRLLNISGKGHVVGGTSVVLGLGCTLIVGGVISAVKVSYHELESRMFCMA